jgi:homogentisate 1,2-dioxygenase
MPLYHKLGTFPKRHTQFEKTNGGLYYEQLFGTEGFHGHSSLLYHVHRPTQVKEILKSYSVEPKIAGKKHQIIIVKRI